MGRNLESLQPDQKMPFPEAFDRGESDETTTPEVRGKGAVLREGLSKVGYDIGALTDPANEALPATEAEKVFRTIHDASAVVFLQWNLSHGKNDKPTEYAAARIFNRLTDAARMIGQKHSLIEVSHIDHLHDAIYAEMVNDFATSDKANPLYDSKRLAIATERAGRERTHENAWPWVVLPTFPDQHYGRILLDTVEISRNPYKTYITQSTFIDGEATLFHTHGLNWSFSRPLGADGANTHVNTLWQPKSREQAFPLVQLEAKNHGKAEYDGGNVIVIPPRVIHAVAGKRKNPPEMSLEDIGKLSEPQKKELIEKTRFGEYSSLHIYRPDKSLSRTFSKEPPVVDGEERRDFFVVYDMIVFNHKTGRVWAGAGGAWEKRMREFGPTGEHCPEKACITEDCSQQVLLDHAKVYDSFIQKPSPSLIVHEGQELIKPLKFV